MLFRNPTVTNAIVPILFLGSAASIQIVATSLYFEKNSDLKLISFGFIITAGIYLLNRVLDKEDKFNNLPRWQFFNGSEIRTFFWVTSSVISLIAPIGYLVVVQKYDMALLFSLITAFGLVYSVKIIPSIFDHTIRWISLKDVPLLKNLIVCVIWAGSALMLVAVSNHIALTRSDVWVIFMTFFICNMNSTITSDARDIEGDKMRNIKTLPVLIGSANTGLFLMSVNIAGLAALTLLGIKQIIPPNLCIFSGLCILWAGISTIPQYTGFFKLPKTHMELLVDSHLLLAAIGMGTYRMF